MTPYGYRIVQGKAEIDPETGPKVRRLFTYYLSGDSINEAVKKADIPLCPATASLMLEREFYTGDDYYPPIVSRETFLKAGEEKKRRMQRGKKRMTPPREPAPVQTKFRIGFPMVTVKTPKTASGRAQFLYRFIRPAAYGDGVISPEDKARIRQHLEEMQETENDVQEEPICQ